MKVLRINNITTKRNQYVVLLDYIMDHPGCTMAELRKYVEDNIHTLLGDDRNVFEANLIVSALPELTKRTRVGRTYQYELTELGERFVTNAHKLDNVVDLLEFVINNDIKTLADFKMKAVIQQKYDICEEEYLKNAIKKAMEYNGSYTPTQQKLNVNMIYGRPKMYLKKFDGNTKQLIMNKIRKVMPFFDELMNEFT